MLGLIKKDLLIVKNNMHFIFIIIAAYVAVGLVEGESSWISFIPALIFLMIIATFSYDEFNKTDAYISTFPCGKNNVVKAKYITTIIIFSLATLVSFILSVMIGFMNNNLNLHDCLATNIGILTGIALVQSIFFPMIYKFGIEKSRIGLFILVFSITGIIAFLSQSGLNIKINIPHSLITLFNNYWFIFLPFLAILILYISYRVSATIYGKKEF